jgi:hypothetical protein
MSFRVEINFYVRMEHGKRRSTSAATAGMPRESFTLPIRFFASFVTLPEDNGLKFFEEGKRYEAFIVEQDRIGDARSAGSGRGGLRGWDE